MTAAPLKPDEQTGMEMAGLSYPRSHDRGPIEARLRRHGRTALSVNYPRSHDRGPIEASRPASTPDNEPNYPRSHDRGPIEAARRCQREGFQNLEGSPRSHDRGPIEANCRAWACRCLVTYPRSHDRGPIEAPSVRPACDVPSDSLSAVT